MHYTWTIFADLVYCNRHQLCQNGGICLNSAEGNYTCQCPAGFKGPNCEHRLTHCGEEPCQNGAKCIQVREEFIQFCIHILFVKKQNGFHCECPEKGGIFGRFCQVRAPRGCQGENVRKRGKRSQLSLLPKNVLYHKSSFLG
jgi:hypothetical protein